ncbi:MAG: universal stress protein [Myxococcota bacterium]
MREATDHVLVVMGPHGRTGVGRVLLGAVTKRVLHHATVPVLVTR